MSGMEAKQGSPTNATRSTVKLHNIKCIYKILWIMMVKPVTYFLDRQMLEWEIYMPCWHKLSLNIGISPTYHEPSTANALDIGPAPI